MHAHPSDASQAPSPILILGSTSPYRRELLSRLRWPFEVASPEVNECPLPGETPRQTSLRLATLKAQAVAERRTDDVVVIGSDQVADLDGTLLGKPGDHAGARQQLQAMRGRTVHFHTAVCVKRVASGFEQTQTSTVSVRFRMLSDEAIDTYLHLEQPYDCAGSAKCEGLGIVLLERIDSDDPTALVGLPLILTTGLLQAAGLDVLKRPPGPAPLVAVD
ncbi:MAG: septum formation protein Maf [Aquabacterium sp.]|jgi:septum formation protein|uniref:Maf family nucleotide pyrophosphatase n=1 Tax=Aquabacterium sp. TaxID=1872578 RepID=UPI001B47A43B|nr:Maf family nucleotide pyrophosphatase [Aquabacterium sp.]MBP7131598.1 septum formation protein Maf [Aquabacterium sp.]MBP9062365.1 septum formation protein Maf [Aquabacterium sp.]